MSKPTNYHFLNTKKRGYNSEFIFEKNSSFNYDFGS